MSNWIIEFTNTHSAFKRYYLLISLLGLCVLIGCRNTTDRIIGDFVDSTHGNIWSFYQDSARCLNLPTEDSFYFKRIGSTIFNTEGDNYLLIKNQNKINLVASYKPLSENRNRFVSESPLLSQCDTVSLIDYRQYIDTCRQFVSLKMNLERPNLLLNFQNIHLHRGLLKIDNRAGFKIPRQLNISITNRLEFLKPSDIWQIKEGYIDIPYKAMNIVFEDKCNSQNQTIVKIEGYEFHPVIKSVLIDLMEFSEIRN